MTARRARTAAIVGWAVLALAAPGIAYIIGGVALLVLLVRHLAQQVDAGEVTPGADCGCHLCADTPHDQDDEDEEDFWRRVAEQWRAELSPEGDES